MQNIFCVVVGVALLPFTCFMLKGIWHTMKGITHILFMVYACPIAYAVDIREKMKEIHGKHERKLSNVGAIHGRCRYSKIGAYPR